jgi:hypothetical protein
MTAVGRLHQLLRVTKQNVPATESRQFRSFLLVMLPRVTCSVVPDAGYMTLEAVFAANLVPIWCQ